MNHSFPKYTSFIILDSLKNYKSLYCANYKTFIYYFISLLWNIHIYIHYYILGILKGASEANSHSLFNANNVASIPLTKNFIRVDSPTPHNCLAGLQYPFGLIVFTSKNLNSQSYATLVTSIMPSILAQFLDLYEHTVDSIKPFLSQPSPANSRNQQKYNVPASHDQSGLTYSSLTGSSLLFLYIPCHLQSIFGQIIKSLIFRLKS